jgi:hypothetical protein
MHEHATHLNASLSDTLNIAKDSALAVLEDAAGSSSFGKIFRQSFGSSYDREAAANLRSQWESGRFDTRPDLQVLTDRQLNGANGAYASSNQTIYISKDLLRQARNTGDITGVVGVLLEEVGHFVDDLINPEDTPGDEGELFAALVQGQSLSRADILAIRAEDDSAVLNIDGQELQVEQSAFAHPLEATFGFTQQRGNWVNNTKTPRMMADINGDGRADIVGFRDSSVFVALSRGDGTYRNPTSFSSNFTRSSEWRNNDNNQFPRMMADVNGDGKADIVAFGRNSVSVLLGTGDGRFRNPIQATISFTKSRGWTDNNNHPRMMADVNGDGRADIVGFHNNFVYVAFGQANGTFRQAVEATTSFTKARGWSDNNNLPRMLADVNGDGRADIVGFFSNRVYVAFGNQNGTFSTPIENTASFTKSRGWTDNSNTPRMVADINGDGRADIIGFDSNFAYVALGNRNGKFSAPVAVTSSYTKSRGWTNNSALPRIVADINGDGRADIIGFGAQNIFTSLQPRLNPRYTYRQADYLNTLYQDKVGNRMTRVDHDGTSAFDSVDGDRDNRVFALVGGVVIEARNGREITGRRPAQSDWVHNGTIAIYNSTLNKTFIYWHFAAGSINEGLKGKIINPGAQIGREGNTGYSFGAHTHVQVHEGRVTVNMALGIAPHPRTRLNLANVFQDAVRRGLVQLML